MTPVLNPSRYGGKTASLATMHGKLELISPHMDALGLRVFTSLVDTDKFGTFSGDVARLATPYETAVAKAREGMDVSGSTIGIASEGSISVQGFLPFVADIETVVFIDDDNEFVLAESAVSHQIITHSWTLSHGLAVEADLVRAGFPDHGLIVRTNCNTVATTKGIHDRTQLNLVIEQCWEMGATQVIVESDLRAHHSPSRRPTISEAARKLAQRLLISCPECDCPGWGQVDIVCGQRCGLCGSATQGKLADVFGCCRCDAKVTGVVNSEPADPSNCQRCNP